MSDIQKVAGKLEHKLIVKCAQDISQELSALGPEGQNLLQQLSLHDSATVKARQYYTNIDPRTAPNEYKNALNKYYSTVELMLQFINGWPDKFRNLKSVQEFVVYVQRSLQKLRQAGGRATAALTSNIQKTANSIEQKLIKLSAQTKLESYEQLYR